MNGQDEQDEHTGQPEQPDHEVAIIGAGLGGIGVAIALQRAGIEDFVLLERAGDIGGTWRDNTYPGIAVDIPAQAYQFSFELNPDWSRSFAKGAEVKAYVDRCAAKYGILPHVRLGAEVRRREWDDANHLWRLRLGSSHSNGSDTDGSDTDGTEVTARFVVSAIGAFVEPKPVDIAGVDDFAGKIIRSSQWDHGYDLRDKRVAVVGTGASAVQIVPEIAPIVGQLDVYQRTPIWVGPKSDYEVPPVVQDVFRRHPVVQRLVRRVWARAVELILIDLVVHHERVPFVTKGLAAAARRLWYRQVRDPEVRHKLTPTYGIGCKRPSVSNDYLATFNRDDVELVTDPIERITPHGIRTQDGSERPVDAIVLATGFRMASDPEVFRRTPVKGRNGFDLATFYATKRLESYESISIPKLPNHFMVFGPYGWTGGTWHELVEVASAHIVRIIGESRRRRATAVEVTQAATDRWTAQMRRRLAGSLFNTNDCGSAHSYYFDHHGDTPFLRPTSSRQARRASRTFPFDDYEFRYLVVRPRGVTAGGPHEHGNHIDTPPEPRPEGADSPDRVRLPR